LVNLKGKLRISLALSILSLMSVTLFLSSGFLSIQKDSSVNSLANPIRDFALNKDDEDPIFVLSYSFDFDLYNNLYLVFIEQQSNHKKLVFKHANSDYLWNLTGETIFDENGTLELHGDPFLETTPEKLMVANQFIQGANCGLILFQKGYSDKVWDQQILLSNDSYLIKEPIIQKVPNNDSLLVSWRDYSEGSYNVYTMLYNTTTQLTSNLTRISDNTGLNCSDHDFTFDNQGNIHFTWAQGANNFEKIAYRQIFKNGTLLPIEYLTDGVNRCKEPVIIIDENEAANIFFGNYTEINPELDYGTKNINTIIKIEAGNWTHSLDIAPYVPVDRPPSGESDAEKPTVTLDAENNLWLAYEIREQVYYHMGIDIRYRNSLGWQDGQRVSMMIAGCIAPLIKTDNAGNVHCLWLDPRYGAYEVYYRIRFISGQWTDEMSLSFYPIGSGGVLRIIFYILGALVIIVVPVFIFSIMRRRREKKLLKRKINDLYE